MLAFGRLIASKCFIGVDFRATNTDIVTNNNAHRTYGIAVLLIELYKAFAQDVKQLGEHGFNSVKPSIEPAL